MATVTDPVEVKRIVSAFLKLPGVTLSSVYPLDHDDESLFVFAILRDYVHGRPIPVSDYRVLLRADREGWFGVEGEREVTVELNNVE